MKSYGFELREKLLILPSKSWLKSSWANLFTSRSRKHQNNSSSSSEHVLELQPTRAYQSLNQSNASQVMTKLRQCMLACNSILWVGSFDSSWRGKWNHKRVVHDQQWTLSSDGARQSFSVKICTKILTIERKRCLITTDSNRIELRKSYSHTTTAP